MTSQPPETPDEYLKRLNEQSQQARPQPTDGGADPSWQGYGTPPTGSSQPGYGQQGYDPASPYAPQPGPDQWAQAGYQPVAPAHPSASTAMVLGLIALIGSFFTCGLTLLLGPFGWQVGSKAVREIDASGGAMSGRDQANAGKIMGIISTILLVLSLFAVIAFVAWFALVVDSFGP